MSEARRSIASFSTWLTKRMIEASSAALSRFVSLTPPLSSTTCRPLSSSSVSIVSAPTPSRFFISRWITSVGASTGRSRRPVRAFSPSRPWVAKSRLVAISIWLSTRRSGSSSSRSSRRAGKSERTCLSGSSSSSDGIADAVFAREPAQHALLGDRFGRGILAEERPRIGRGELPVRDHARRAARGGRRRRRPEAGRWRAWGRQGSRPIITATASCRTVRTARRSSRAFSSFACVLLAHLPQALEPGLDFGIRHVVRDGIAQRLHLRVVRRRGPRRSRRQSRRETRLRRRCAGDPLSE